MSRSSSIKVATDRWLEEVSVVKLSSLIEALPEGEVKRLGIKAGEDVDIYSVGFDSRQSLPGELFVALKGQNFDGEDYVDDALRRGAVAIVSEREALRLGCARWRSSGWPWRRRLRTDRKKPNLRASPP